MGVSSEILIQTPKERKHITGETIKGIVKFHLDKETVYTKISLSLVEKAHCSWYEHEHIYEARNVANVACLRRKVGNQYIFEGHETNVIAKIYFLNEDMDENTTLSAGSYEYPFEMEIPEDIPPSIKTDIGEIKYYLILKFKRPGLFNWNKNFKTKVTIYPRIDSSITEQPLFCTLDKTLKKLFSCKKYEINLKAELDKGYLIPNSERKISFEVTNNSYITFTVKTELLCKMQYKDNFMVQNYMNDRPKTVIVAIDSCTVKSPSVPDNSVSNMFNMIPVAPELHTVRHSNIISREYMLKVTLKLPLPHINSSVEIPVFVGERLNKGNDEEGDSCEPIEDPPSYWQAMSEDKSKE